MSTTITAPGFTPITPRLAEVSSYALTSRARNIVHDILDGPPVITLREAGTDSGTLTLIFDDETAARDAHAIHKTAAVFTMVTTDQEGLTFRYVPTGDITLTLDPVAVSVYILTVDFQAVA